MDGGSPGLEMIVPGCGDVLGTEPTGRFVLGNVFYGTKTGIYEISVAEKKCIPLLPDVLALGGVIAPDGRSFVYTTASRHNAIFCRQAWRDGKVIGPLQVALKLPSASPLTHYGNGYDIAPDLSTVVYVRPGGHAEVYLLKKK